ncbi:hypothetical protein MUP95_01660, partial [bacterium]|nr:hypothetical protein [bacterium]
MNGKTFAFISVFIGLAFLHCGLLEPDWSPGSLKIVLVKEEPMQKIEAADTLSKTAETLYSVGCIVKKG